MPTVKTRKDEGEIYGESEMVKRFIILFTSPYDPLYLQVFKSVLYGESETSCIFDVSPYYVPEILEERAMVKE
jgi:hypothetical protein